MNTKYFNYTDMHLLVNMNESLQEGVISGFKLRVLKLLSRGMWRWVDVFLYEMCSI